MWVYGISNPYLTAMPRSSGRSPYARPWLGVSQTDGYNGHAVRAGVSWINLCRCNSYLWLAPIYVQCSCGGVSLRRAVVQRATTSVGTLIFPIPRQTESHQKRRKCMVLREGYGVHGGGVGYPLLSRAMFELCHEDTSVCEDDIHILREIFVQSYCSSHIAWRHNFRDFPDVYLSTTPRTMILCSE